MKPSEATKKLLLDAGWKYTGSCNCGGVPTTKFKLDTDAGEYLLKVRYSNFTLSKPGQRFVRYNISELKHMTDDIRQNNKTI